MKIFQKEKKKKIQYEKLDFEIDKFKMCCLADWAHK